VIARSNAATDAGSVLRTSDRLDIIVMASSTDITSARHAAAYSPTPCPTSSAGRTPQAIHIRPSAYDWLNDCTSPSIRDPAAARQASTPSR
jgi:hypothetical protein